MSILCLRKVRGGIVLAAALLGGPLFTVGMLAPQVPALAAEVAPPAEEEDPAVPDLAIEIDDGHTSVSEGDRLTYTVKIRNIGTVDAGDLLVTQTLPAGLRFDSADRDGVSSDGAVTWRTDLPAGRDTAFAVRAEVAKPPSGQLRLASVVCAMIDGDSRPIVCAADSDRLPASENAGDAAEGSDGSSGLSGWLTVLYVGLGVVLVLLLALIVWRRRRSRPSAGTRSGSHRQVAPDLDPDSDRAEVRIPDSR